MELGKALRMAVDTGKVEFGSKKALDAAVNGSAKLIIIAGNCPADFKATLERYSKASGVKTLNYEGTSLELGELCGKPFPVVALSVIEEGNSAILQE